MIRIRLAISIFLAAAGAIGCGLMRLPAVTAEQRPVRAASDPQKSVTILEPMVWADAPAGDTKAIDLPSGAYTLEAQDDEYWYFRAPAPIEMRVMRNGTAVDGRDISGGLMLSKARLNLVPAGVYIDVDTGHKMLVFKLGSDFLSFEGEKWERSY